MKNVDNFVVKDFGDEWDIYKQEEYRTTNESFDQYFSIFPWQLIDKESEGFDMGCGSGRWARFVAPNVRKLNCIDPSKKALAVAKLNLKDLDNCTFEQSIIEDCSLKDCSQDFGYCLGVLHHIPDTLSGMKECIKKLRPGAPFLIYIYYRFDNKPFAFKLIWHCSDILRKFTCRLPFSIKLAVSKVISALIYYPLAKFSLLAEFMGYDVQNIPLSDYRNKTFYFMSTDALDRFGTRLEQRFTKSEIQKMMRDSGLESIRFSNSTPFWVAIGLKQHK